MSLRFSLIGLAVVLALGAAIYVGMEAGGGPAVKSSARAPAATAKSEPNEKASPSGSKASPAPAPLMAGTASSQDPAAAKAGLPGDAAMTAQELTEALKQLDTLSDGPDKQKRRGELVALLAAADPHLALDYVGTLTGDEQAQQKTSVLGVWAQSDPTAAGTYFQESLAAGQTPTDEDRKAAAAIANAWASRDTHAAWGWVNHLPAEVRAEATAAVVTRMAEKDPQVALRAVRSLVSPDERAAAMQPLAAEWAHKAPVVTAAWVSGLADDAEKNYAASGLMTGWMTISPRAASEWVAQLPQGDAKDSAIVAMVQAPTAMKSPEGALTWAASIQNLELRNEILPQILRQWQALDPAGAQSFITKHSKKK